MANTVKTLDYGVVMITKEKYSCLFDKILDCIQTSAGDWFTIYQKAGAMSLSAYKEEE